MVLWAIVGLAYGVLVAIGLQMRGEVAGFGTAGAWRHALILGVVCGLATWMAMLWDLSNGYGLVITLVVVLRPVPDFALQRTRERIVGTLGCGLVALVAAMLLPEDWLLACALLCMWMLFSYIAAGNYTMYVIFMTPCLLLLMVLSQPEMIPEITRLRILETVAAASVAGLIALGLQMVYPFETRPV